MSTSLRFDLDRVDDVAVLSVSGDGYLPDAALLLGALCDLVRTSVGAVGVVDLSGLAVPATPAMLSAFPAALRRCGGWPTASMHLAAPSGDLAEAMRRQSIHRFMPVHDTVAQAVMEAEQEMGRSVWRSGLEAGPSGLARVRRLVASFCGSNGCDNVDDAVLVVNELAQNALSHAAPPFTVSVSGSAARTWLAVSDLSSGEPRLRDGTVPGSGLSLVAGLSQGWGVRLQLPRGKTVWAEPSPTARPGSAGWPASDGVAPA